MQECRLSGRLDAGAWKVYRLKMEEFHKIYKERYLDEALKDYAESDYYPFHMPGHKRNISELADPYKIDITEIEGFDHLHQAEGILLEAQNRLCRLYGSRRAYYLVNGSTCGLLSAIGAVVKPKENILIARNCHKAVYNAVKIFGLKADYVYPQFLSCGIQGAVTPEDVEKALRKQGNTRAVVITSPTYDGIVSDIKKIAEITHKFNAYLIVDEAHGAHFSLSPHVPRSAIGQGADLVIQSLHKTLPSFTQTAALHVASDRADAARVEEMLGIFETSSPSYVLMAGIDRCVRLLETSADELFDKLNGRLKLFYDNCKELKRLHVFTKEDLELDAGMDADPAKILISTLCAGISGEQLYRRLLEKYHLQLELYSADYALAMAGIMDTEEGFQRLFCALKEIDAELSFGEMSGTWNGEGRFLQEVYAEREKVWEISEASYAAAEETEESCCAGKISAEYIYLYPPGIPMLVPGERITEDFLAVLRKCRELHLNVQGIRDKILTVAHI